MPNKKSSTLRIDLIPDVPGRATGEGQQAGGAPPFKRAKWLSERKVPAYVARSRYQELLQSVYDAALITDLSGNIVDSNVRACEFFQYERAELSKMRIFDVISGADETLIETLCDNLERDRFTLIQAYCARQDGTVFPAEVAVNKLRLEEMRLCFFVRDITLRMQAEESMLTEHYAIHNADNGIVIADLDLKLEYGNPAFARMLGYEDPADLENLVGEDMRELLSDAETAEELLASVTGEPGKWTSDLQIQGADGSEAFVQVAATCSRDAEGEPLGVVFSLADVTGLRIAQETLEGAQEQLEHQVAERTAELAGTVTQREEEITELRAKVEQLVQELADAKAT